MVNVSTYYGTRDDIAPNDKTSNNIITNCRISNAKKLTTNECDIISNDHNPECDATCSNSKKGILKGYFPRFFSKIGQNLATVFLHKNVTNLYFSLKSSMNYPSYKSTVRNQI